MAIRMIPRESRRALLLVAVFVGSMALQGASHPPSAKKDSGSVNATATVLPAGANGEIEKVLTGNTDKDLTRYGHKLAARLWASTNGEEEQLAGALYRMQKTEEETGQRRVLLLIEYLGN